jgi:nucleobase:cation symporter-1, NCS1 family
MQAADLGPVPSAERTQSPVDLFLIFAGANIVTTTLQAGAALAAGGPTGSMALVVLGSGVVAGSLLVAALAPVGPRLGVPSIIAARAVFGLRGAGLVAALLYLTNFAWIAINNAVAASVAAVAVDAPGANRLLALAMGLAATLVVSRGARAVWLADRVAVPAMAIVATLVTVALFQTAHVSSLTGQVHSAPAQPKALMHGLDIVIGYQVSWILMFADFSRYSRSGRRSAAAVFLGLALTSLWLMPVGLVSARLAGSTDPGAMIAASGVGRWGALLVALATITTNFVNIYLSSLAWKSLVPRAGDQRVIWSIGLVGTALGLLSADLLERFGEMMYLLGSLLVPVGGVLVAHFLIVRRPVRVEDLYDRSGPLAQRGGISLAGVGAWAAGIAAYHVSGTIGSFLPSLSVSIFAYVVLARWVGGSASGAGARAPE